ncbi:MAG: hypothetical protein HZA08_10945 [Nitrospirae bacterium]|nr:hypothetical protein [Nitrospirota bacterium]
MSISPNIAKALSDITGQPKVELAIHDIIRDAVEHRLEKIHSEIKRLEEKYLMPFKEFDMKFQSEMIPDQFSYSVEKDYLEWEGLVSRKGKLEEILKYIL